MNLQTVDKAQMESLKRSSSTDPRQRQMHILHQYPDIVQRMVNVLQPDSYIRPHRHCTPEKFETFVVLEGKIGVFVFDVQGTVLEKSISSPDNRIFDLLPPAWHSYIVLEQDTIVFEVKQGPYIASEDKEFAAWAPEENSAGVQDYLASLRSIAG
jgi:cupin fold WbuC family metalloprotein